ncbi:MAG: PEP-CTERM sorting domain-containing protein [Pirellulaceae bacterium]
MKFGIGILVALYCLADFSYGALVFNGDFELDPILGAGQSTLNAGTPYKWTATDPSQGPNYSGSISGVQGWNYSLPFNAGTHSDSGLGRVGLAFGLAEAGQQAYINNWNRLMSQTVTLPALNVGDRIDATIDFGTLETTGTRAGTFYLVAGTADPNNLDVFAPGSIILDSVVAANPGWTNSVADITTASGNFVQLNLSHTFTAGDVALGRPITLAFRTEFFSVGPTYWDNATLTVSAVPEPSAMVLVIVGGAVVVGRRSRKLS